MDALKWLLPALLFFPAIKLIQIISAVRILRGLRFGEEPIEKQEADDLPGWFREAATPLADQLAALGFTPRFVVLKRSLLGSVFDTHSWCFGDASGHTLAVLRLHASAAREGAAYVTFHTPLPNGRDLVTLGHRELEITAPPAEQEIELHAGLALPDLLARHRDRIEQSIAAGVAPQILSDDELLARDRTLLAAVHARLIASGRVCPAPAKGPELPATWMLTWRAALVTARSILRAARSEGQKAKMAPRAVAVIPQPPLTEETRTEIELRHYRQMLLLQDLRFSWMPKALFMVVTLAFFALALHWTFSPGMGLVLIAALTFHEAGHLLGMRLFGYKDTQLLFLPFLGGVAVGRDRLVLAPWKRLVILFLGPLPGIFAGIGILLWSGMPGVSAFWREAGILVLVFNAFNLLPILPLDGGQIMDVALVSRFPRLRVVFLLLSGLGLIGVGYASSSLLLQIVGGFMLFRLPSEWKQAAVVKTLRRELPPAADEDLVLRRLLSELRRVFAPAMGAVQRIQQARVLEERIRRPRPGFGTIAFAAAGYVLPPVLGMGLAFFINVQRGERLVSEARERVASAGLLESPTPAHAMIAAEQNAALPLIELDTLFLEKWSPANTSAEDRAQAIELFAKADARPSFAIPSGFESSGEPPGLQGVSFAYAALATEARERLRYRDYSGALGLAARGLSVLRHLRQSPGAWNCDYDREAREALWTVVEEALAQGAPLTEPQLAVFVAATDETALLTHAHAALLRSRIDSARWLGKSESGEETPRYLATLVRFSIRLSPGYFSRQVGYYDDTITLDRALRKIRDGLWSDTTSESADQRAAETEGDAEEREAWTQVGWELARLADDVAALRLARAGLALHRRLSETPNLPATAQELTAPWPMPPMEAPDTRDPITLSIRGGFAVLALPRSGPLLSMSESSAEHTWRVPLPKTDP